MDRQGNLYYFIKPREDRDTSTSVYGLGEPENYIPNYSSGGDIVIADFHTHVNELRNPDEEKIANGRGVPGIWVYPSGKAEAYGPNRGLLGKDLPEGCK